MKMDVRIIYGRKLGNSLVCSATIYEFQFPTQTSTILNLPTVRFYRYDAIVKNNPLATWVKRVLVLFFSLAQILKKRTEGMGEKMNRVESTRSI